MDTVYITGHRNPDTDSIVSAMAYAALKNALGQRQYRAARLGQISDETKAVLQKFDAQPPELIHNVRTQVRDLVYDTPPYPLPRRHHQPGMADDAGGPHFRYARVQ